MFVQTVNLPYFHHADKEALRDQEKLERDEREDELLADDGVEERGDDEEYLQDDGEEEAGAEVIIAVALSNIVHLLSSVPDISQSLQQVTRGRRGKDLEWRDWEVFETREEWETSAVVENLKTDFTLRTGKLSSRQVYHCRFAQKKGINCGVKMKLTFSEIDDSVSVQGLGEHNHELQVQEEQEGAKNLCWTSEQTKVVMTGVLKKANAHHHLAQFERSLP